MTTLAPDPGDSRRNHRLRAALLPALAVLALGYGCQIEQGEAPATSDAQAGQGGSGRRQPKGGAAGASGASGEAGAAGAGGAGGEADDGGGSWSPVAESLPELAPGSLAAPCGPGGACAEGLVCGAEGFCLASLSDLPAQVVWAVPPRESGRAPVSSPVVLLLDGAYGDLSFTVDVVAPDGAHDWSSRMGYSRLKTQAGDDVLVLAPTRPFPLGSSVRVRLAGPLTGSLTFAVDGYAPGSADADLGLEGEPFAPDAGAPDAEPPEAGDEASQAGQAGQAGQGGEGGSDGNQDGGAPDPDAGEVDDGGAMSDDGGGAGDDGGDGAAVEAGVRDPFRPLPAGWAGAGDVAVAVDQAGSVWPVEGHRFAVLTTGSTLGPGAVAGRSSTLVSGPITRYGATSKLRFSYEFQSSELYEYCKERHDDVAVAVLAGPKGAVATLLSSVRSVCASHTAGPAVFPGMPDMGDSTYAGSGRQQAELSASIGSPVVLSIVVSDVVDDRLSTVVVVDALE